MGKKILFTPIGNTDPIKYLHDGSMLHISRHYKPDVIYLYFTKEMAENHRKDNRYVYSLELLGKYIGHPFEIRTIIDEDMVEAQQYDVFFEKFRKLIGEIESKKAPDDKVIVNMASGTPAMKSALLVMATLAEYRFIPVQVSSPQKKSNIEHEERTEYDAALNWENDLDNLPDAVNRCEEVRCMNLVLLLKIDMVKKHVLSYDYHAALEVGKSIQEDLSKEALQWLETADARASLDWARLNRVVPEGNGIIGSVRNANRRKILFEYMLNLDLKVKRGEYADFIRAITPMGVDLLELVLEQYCNIHIEQYYTTSGTVKKWNEKKLANTELLNILRERYKYGGGFKYGPVYSDALNGIIQKKCTDPVIAQRTEEIVRIEHKIRNIAAHSIVSATPEWIKQRTGKSVEEILWMLKFLCEKTKINIRKENWESFNDMNQKIIQILDKVQ